MPDSLTRALAAVVTAAALVLAPAALGKKPPESTLRAGAAEADITGPVGSPMFAYTARSYIFSPDSNDPTQPALRQRALQIVSDPDTGLYAKTFEPSVGIHTRLLSRAIVLEQGGQKWALAQAELGGLPYALVQEVAGRIASTGIDAQHILLSATHTHSSVGAIWPADNNGYAYVGGDAFDPRVFESTAAGIAQAIIAANARLKPALVGVGTTQVTDASRNRAYEAYLHDVDIPAPNPADGNKAQHDYSIDPTVTVLRVDSTDGTPIALWSNFAVHPTSFGDGNLFFSGDNAGVAARLAEQAIRRQSGRKANGIVDVWSNSAQGDISPAGETGQIDHQDVDYTESDASKAYLAGARDAAGIVSAWRAARDHLSGTLPIGSRSFFFAFDGTTQYKGIGSPKSEAVFPNPVLGQGGIVQDDGTCAPFDDFAGPGQGAKLPLLGGPGLVPISVPVSFLRIGKLGIAAYPVEITKQLGVRIRGALLSSANGALDRIVIAGLTNGYWSYTTTPEEYDYCGYEGSFTLFGREEGYGWMAAGKQLETSLLGGPGASGFPAPPPDTAVATTRSTPPRTTPDAGTAVTQPADVARYGRAVFAWKGGDPQVDATRGETFVSLQRRSSKGGSWTTVDTDDTPADTVGHSSGDVWTETFQFDRCKPLGTYRFEVTGHAVKSAGAGASDYTIESKPFALGAAKITPGPATVNGGVASVTPLYPDPGAGQLIALPRLVLGGDVVLALSNGTKVRATDPDGNGTYTASVGTASVTGVLVTDDCGNAGP